MAGIGFELKKLFSRRGLLAMLSAYGYAGVVCAGPMLLGVILLLGVRFVSAFGGATEHQQDLLVAMITYTMLASLTLSSLLSMITTRFTADMIFMDKPERILPSFYGSTSALLVIGAIGYGIFLFFSGVATPYKVLCFFLFCELVVVWMQINYITSVKDYRSIFLFFFLGIVIAAAFGFLFVYLGLEIVSAMMIAACIGYGTMMASYFVILIRYFPHGKGSSFRFLEWIERYPSLITVGAFLTIGLFSHLVIMWLSPIGVQVEGLFYGAPQYDIPALIAFLSALATTINFVTSVEVNFYPKYKQYFSLFNDGGSMNDIELAQEDMQTVLKHELNYLGLKQFVVAVLFIVIVGPLLSSMNIGFTETMLGTFRILCVGYALYAIANSIMLSILYFSDNNGAFVVAFTLMVFASVGTLLLMNGNQAYYGFGFLGGAVLMYIAAWLRLSVYTKKLQYHILCAQPLLVVKRNGIFTRISRKLEERAEKMKA